MRRVLRKKFITMESGCKIREGREVGAAIKIDESNVTKGSMDLLYIT